MSRAAALTLLVLLSSCLTSPPTSREFDAPPEQLARVVRGVLGQGGDVSQSDGTYSTGWREDLEARESWNSFGRPLRAQSKYFVRIEGNRIEVDAQTRMFIPPRDGCSPKWVTG